MRLPRLLVTAGAIAVDDAGGDDPRLGSTTGRVYSHDDPVHAGGDGEPVVVDEVGRPHGPFHGVDQMAFEFLCAE